MPSTSAATAAAAAPPQQVTQHTSSLQRAQELQREADASNQLFVAGRKCYEKGLYTDSVALFQQALSDQHGGRDSRLGGDIQLWLGLAYQVQNWPVTCMQLRRLQRTPECQLPPKPWRAAKPLCF